MNLSLVDFDALARERGVAPLALARDFMQLDILRRIADSDLRAFLCFKGGTALHLAFNMERFSADLDFSLTQAAPPRQMLALLRESLAGEEIADSAVKRKSVLAEIRQGFRPQNIRLKIEINTDDIAPAQLKTLYSEYIPGAFDLQIMRVDYLVAQKIRALLQRAKGRDLYDLWFILRTRLPIKRDLIGKLMGIAEGKVIDAIIDRVESLKPREMYADLGSYLEQSRRAWIQASLREDVLQLLRALPD